MRRPDVIRFAAVALLRQRSRALVLILAVSLSVTSVLLLTALGEGRDAMWPTSSALLARICW